MVYRSVINTSSVCSNDGKTWSKDAFLQSVENVIFDKAQGLFGLGSPVLETLRYHCKGGKRLRALLPALMARYYGVEPQIMIPLAAACEVIHNATLVHDDLQDGDQMRRGQPSVWRRFGEARAINLGDALIILSYALLDSLPFAADMRSKTIRRMCMVCAQALDGQERELVSRQLTPEEVTTEYILQIAQGKTSALFELPLVASAELCGASDDELQLLERGARHLGIYFQLQDDLLDFLGHKSGRPARSDLLEGKRSILVALACERFPKKTSLALLDFLDSPHEQKTQQKLHAYGTMLEEKLEGAYTLLERQRELFRHHLGENFQPLVDEILPILIHAKLAQKQPKQTVLERP